MSKVEYINKGSICHTVIWCTNIQLNICKCIGGISKKVVPNLTINKEISFWGNRVVLLGAIYHEGGQSHCGH